MIIPIYNVAPYLREYLDSVQNQSYENFLAIMINDGNTDENAQIAQEYLSDPRFVLINQENQGLALVRNAGLEYLKHS
ncbi:glycosyltransferase family A protein [uncultured Helicobacter sp.]|uniref:glycosyltransferase family A protein n=1 Tax=uncultured Helicobacter sp. TaxID=175537 RepID=UPI0033905EF2